MKQMKITIDLFRRMFPIFLAIVALSAMSVSVWAKTGNSSNAISATIKLATATKVGNTQLAAGEYKVIADANQAKFQKGNKVVAQVPCTLKELPFMPHATVFVLDHDSIAEIQVSGTTQAIEFSSALSAGS